MQMARFLIRVRSEMGAHFIADGKNAVPTES